MRRLLIVLMLVLAVGCSSDEPTGPEQDKGTSSGQAVPDQSVTKTQPAAKERKAASGMLLTLTPDIATRGTVLQAKTGGFSLANAQLVWMLNGVPISTPRVEFFDSPELDIMKGDRIQAKAVIDGDEVLSNVVTIVNAKPVIDNVNFVVPDNLETNQMLSVDITAKDEDDDPITLEYKWEKNGVSAGTGPSIELALRRGDKFAVTIVPFDGEEYGEEVSLERTMGNFPPRVAQQYSFAYENGIYTYQVQAEDPDGDTMTYVLKSGPEGMVIDSSTGLVTWKAPDDFKGTAPFSVAIMDGQGGETQMEMSLIAE